MSDDDFAPLESVQPFQPFAPMPSRDEQITQRLDNIASHHLWTNGLLMAVIAPLWILVLIQFVGCLVTAAKR